MSQLPVKRMCQHFVPGARTVTVNSRSVINSRPVLKHSIVFVGDDIQQRDPARVKRTESHLRFKEPITHSSPHERSYRNSADCKQEQQDLLIPSTLHSHCV